MVSLAISLLAALAPPIAAPFSPTGGSAATRPASPDVVAPPGRWYTEGGCAARTGVTATPPLRGPIEPAWIHEAGGEIEGEPLVWDERIVIAVRTADDRRSLRVLDLRTGEAVYEDERFKTTVPLTPSLWRDRIVVRASPEKLLGLRMGSKRVRQVWHHKSDVPIGPPLLLGSEVYLVEGDDLVRLAWGRGKALWTATGIFRGRVSVRDDEVFAVSYDPRNMAHLRTLRRRDGTELGSRIVGHHSRDSIPAADVTEVAVQVFDFGQILWFGEPLRFLRNQIGGELEHHWLGLGTQAAKPGQLEFLPGTQTLASHVVPSGKGWIGALITGGDQVALAELTEVDSPQFIKLADPAANGDFVPPAGGVTRAGGVLYSGARAWDRETRRVLWRRDERATSRAVPARGAVLYVVGGRELHALRRAGTEELSVPPEGAVAETKEALIVRRSGAVETGDVHWDAGDERLVLEDGKQQERIPLDELLVVENGEGLVLLAPAPAAFVRGLGILADRALATEYVSLAKRARKGYDTEQMQRLADAAMALGADDDELARVFKDLDKLDKKPRRTISRTVDVVNAAELELEAFRTEFLATRLANLTEATSEAARQSLLRSILKLDGEHELAVELVRARIPEELRPRRGADNFDALDWLDFVEATRRAPVQVVRVVADGANLSFDERQLGLARTTWREDLIGVRSENLLVLTPATRVGALARCLVTGELVCDALEALFAEGKLDRDERHPMILFLYEDKQEYLRKSAEELGGIDLTWTAGHYSAMENVTRLYLPEGQEAFEAVLGTFVHELTHHWMRARCPMVEPRTMTRQDTTQPGYWLVEGFAELIAGLRFDVERWSWSEDASQALHLDLVANAEDGQVLDWSNVYGLSHKGFLELKTRGEPKLPSRCYLGQLRTVNGRIMYYKQAGATCHYLYAADGGAHRQLLVELLREFYSGTAEREDLEVTTRMGISPDELGARVRAHARAELGMD